MPYDAFVRLRHPFAPLKLTAFLAVVWLIGTYVTVPIQAQIINGLVGYGHFCIEHNRGHHVSVATPEDCVSARMGETIYKFALREIPGAFRRGWILESERLNKEGRRTWSPRNEILLSWLLTLAIAAALIATFGWIMIPFLVVHHVYAWYGLTQANYQRIREGMTLPEVEGLLGGPPGNYSRIPDKEAGLWTIDPDRPDLNRQFFIGREVWVGNELAVAVWFDDHGRVARKESYETLDRGLLQRFRDLLGW